MSSVQMKMVCFSMRFKAAAAGNEHVGLNLAGKQSRGGLLRGEVLKPATELATKVSAICLRASRLVGLLPFLCCSWIRLSNSSLKAWRMGGEREREKH